MIALNKTPAKILVVGDLMLDVYAWGKTERISPEAPVPVVEIEKESVVLGGAGNVINNLLAFGAKVSVLSVLGDDESKDELLAMLEKDGVATSGVVIEKSRKTSKKTRVMASNQQIVRFDKESKASINASSEDALISLISAELTKCDVCLLSDYGKGVLTHNLTQEIIKKAKDLNKKVLVDPKGKDYSKYKGAYLITPNRKEASEAVGYALATLADVEKAGLSLQKNLDLNYAFITLSEAGMMIVGDEITHIPTKAREVFDVTGAGDTVLASLGFALANNASISSSAIFANTAAAVVVGKIGSATATLEEISEYEQKNAMFASDEKILSADELALKVEKLKALGKKVVFTNGCFDLLHRGHIEYLKKSRNEGDLLIVGLNSDSSVKRLKGETRPIVSEDDRAYILSNLSFVDFVTIFDDETPFELIKLISPDVLTKGADYIGKTVVGSEFAKKVVLVDFVAGKSTSSVVAKINNLKEKKC